MIYKNLDTQSKSLPLAPILLLFFARRCLRPRKRETISLLHGRGSERGRPVDGFRLAAIGKPSCAAARIQRGMAGVSWTGASN